MRVRSITEPEWDYKQASDIGCFITVVSSSSTANCRWRRASLVCHAGYNHRHQLRPVVCSLVQAFVSCRLDYYNSLYGVNNGLLRRLQNAAACLVTGSHWCDHARHTTAAAVADDCRLQLSDRQSLVGTHSVDFGHSNVSRPANAQQIFFLQPIDTPRYGIIGRKKRHDARCAYGAA